MLLTGLVQSTKIKYAAEVQRLQSMRGTPTLKDFQLLENKVGMRTGVAPIGEKENAITALQGMQDLQNVSIMDFMNADVDSYKYVYPNGVVLDDPLKAGRHLQVLNRQIFNNVFYHPASPVELLFERKGR